MFDRVLLGGAPSPAAAAAAAGVSVGVLGREDALLLAGCCERLIRMYQGVQAEAMVQAAGPVPVGDAESEGEPLDGDAEELAVELGGGREFQLGRIDTARFVAAWLPLTSAAMRSGELGWYEATLIVRAAEQLTDPAKIAGLERAVVPRGSFDLARRLRRAVARLDPAAARRKAEQRRIGRGLRFLKDMFGSGEAQLRAQGPSELVALLAAAIDVEAKERRPGDCRTIEMRRFDVLIDWAREKLGRDQDRDRPDTDTDADTNAPPVEVALSDSHRQGVALSDGHLQDEVAVPDDHLQDVALADGHPQDEVAVPDGHPAAVPEGHPAAVPDGHPAAVPEGHPTASSSRRACGACGRSGPPRVPINVTVSLDTLCGLRDDPGELAGWGLIDADTARELAADGEWRRWLVEDGTGRLLDVGSRTYRPNAALERFVRARDRTCRWPNCSRPAIRCDLDHTVAFHTDGGQTCPDNLTALCRRHHRMKHETDWTYHVRRDGTVIWTSPHGHHHIRPPEHHGDLDWLHDDAAAATAVALSERQPEPRPAAADPAPPDW